MSSLRADVSSSNLAYAVFFPLLMLFSTRVLTALPYLTSPFFWGMITWIALVALVVQAPLQRWLILRGYNQITGSEMTDNTRGSLSPALASTFGLVILMLIAVVSQLG